MSKRARTDSDPRRNIVLVDLSGNHVANCTLGQNEGVWVLRTLAQQTVGHTVSLISMSGDILEQAQTLGLNDGDTVAVALVCLPQLQTRRSPRGTAFAAICNNGRLHVWGCPLRGGDCSRERHVADQLTSGVQMAIGSESAFAAVKDGRVITWGIGHGMISYEPPDVLYDPWWRGAW